MNKKLTFLFFACIIFFGSRLNAQNIVNVNPLTGTANITIPIYTITNGQVSVPVSISYSATGVKPKDVEGGAGMGWQLNVGGQGVTRIVRGLPDDITQDNASNSLYGWMSSSNFAANAINSFTISNNGSNCPNELADIDYINSNFLFSGDTEPDMFYVSAPGLSCQMVYDRATSAFHPVEYQDMLISFVRNPATGVQPNQITSFTIKNDKGITYTFGTIAGQPGAETVTQTTSGGTQTYFQTKYNQYKHGVTYYDSWALSSITDNNGNNIKLNYTTSPARSSTDSVALYIGGASSVSLQYYIKQTVTPVNVQNITRNTLSYTSPQSLQFSWFTFNYMNSTGQTAISLITGFGRTWQFNYTPVIFSPSNYARNFLRNFTDLGCSSPTNYQFGYVKETNTAGN